VFLLYKERIRIGTRGGNGGNSGGWTGGCRVDAILSRGNM